SRDDKLCSTMRDFYNRHIRNFDDQRDGYIEEQFADELDGTGVEFVFENKGWRPDSLASTIWNQVLQSLDIYNDGNLRTVVVQDRPISTFLSQYSNLYILNPDVPSDKVADMISDAF